jgi:hypothetical protein
MNETDAQKGPKDETAEASCSPTVIDLGKVRPKRIKQLRQGQGPLVQKVDEALREVRQRLPGELAGKQLVPVVLVYRKKRKKSGRRTLLNPLGLA